MSRHLYDLERLMDTKFGIEAIADAAHWNAGERHSPIGAAANQRGQIARGWPKRHFLASL